MGSEPFTRWFMAPIPARPRMANFEALRGALSQYNDDFQRIWSFPLAIECIAAFCQHVLNELSLDLPHSGLVSSEFRVSNCLTLLIAMHGYDPERSESIQFCASRNGRPISAGNIASEINLIKYSL
jgi:hypothetical protein